MLHCLKMATPSTRKNTQKKKKNQKNPQKTKTRSQVEISVVNIFKCNFTGHL